MTKDAMTPFIEHTVRTFEVMLGETPQLHKQSTKDEPQPTYDISASVGLSGAGSGAVVLSFPREVASQIVGKMVGEDVTGMDQDIADGVGELVNIISGNAKTRMAAFGLQDLSLSLPHVVVGRHRTVWRTKDLPCMVAAFESSFGPFCLEVNLRPEAGDATGGK